METLKHKPYMKLKGKMKENNIIANDLAHLLNISSTAVLQKINGQSDFFLSEATKIVNEYNWKYEIKVSNMIIQNKNSVEKLINKKVGENYEI